VLAGIAGALDAHSSSFIGPSEFGFEPAVTILSFALLGGIATPFAPVLGAFVLTAVDGVDLRVETGGIHAVIGPNGAGKTTLFNLISGLIPPSAGKIMFAGKDVTRRSVHARAALG